MAFQKSTIVRTINRTLSITAPRAAAVVAERLWCSVPRGKPSPATEPGERRDSQGVAVEVWGEGPAVYLLHGWGGRRGQFDAFVAPLVHKGHKVVALDAPGHGDSEPGAFGPGRGLLTEFIAALRAAIAVHGPARGLVGHSLGGLAIAVALLDELPAERVVLIAPAPDTPQYTVDFARALGFSEGVRQRFLRRLGKRVGRPMADFDVLARARETEVPTLPPLLILHDRNDREVRFTDGAALAAAWPRAEFVLTEGLGHGRILRDPAVVERVVDELSTVRT
jgi:pimeloyl-ACP methyl ester carboxylesterase